MAPHAWAGADRHEFRDVPRAGIDLAASSWSVSSGILRLAHLGVEGTLGGAGTGTTTSGPPKQERYAHREHCPGQRPGDIHPVVAEVAAYQVRSEGAGWVHRGPGDRAAPQTGQRDVGTDTEG